MINRSQWHDVRICRSAPFALRLLDVDHFFICDFESLRVAGLHQLANSNNSWNSPPHCSTASRGGSWVGESPPKTLLPGTGPTCTPSSIHPTVWPQYINVINRVNRQTGHRSRSIGRTVTCNGHPESMGLLGQRGGVYYRTSNKNVCLP